MPTADGFVQAPICAYHCICKPLEVPLGAVGAERAYRRGGLLGLDCLRFPAYSGLHCGAVAAVGCVCRSGIPAVKTHYLLLRVVKYAVPKMDRWAVLFHERGLRC